MKSWLPLSAWKTESQEVANGLNKSLLCLIFLNIIWYWLIYLLVAVLTQLQVCIWLTFYSMRNTRKEGVWWWAKERTGGQVGLIEEVTVEGNALRGPPWSTHHCSPYPPVPSWSLPGELCMASNSPPYLKGQRRGRTTSVETGRRKTVKSTSTSFQPAATHSQQLRRLFPISKDLPSCCPIITVSGQWLPIQFVLDLPLDACREDADLTKTIPECATMTGKWCVLE